MKNYEIVAREAIANKIYTKEQIESMETAMQDLGLHTYGERIKMGYQVRKGEKAKIATHLWRKSKKQEYEEDKNGKKIKKNQRFHLCKAYLFTRDQVEKIEDQEEE